MAVETKDLGPAFGLVAPDSFEERAAVVNDMRKDVDFRLFPGDQFPIVPDPIASFGCHRVSFQLLNLLEFMLVSGSGGVKANYLPAKGFHLDCPFPFP